MRHLIFNSLVRCNPELHALTCSLYGYCSNRITTLFVVADVSKAICEGPSQLGRLVLMVATVAGPLSVVVLYLIERVQEYQWTIKLCFNHGGNW
jgi:hypothetical protein